MAGEDLPAAEITASGLLGDRAYALVDRRNGKVASAKSPEKWGELLNFRALFLTPPRAGERMPGVGITLPDGTVVTSEQEDLGEVLSTVLRREVKLLASAPAGLLLEFPAGTLSGPYASITEAPIAGAAPPGTFFDYAPVHLLTTSSLRRLRELYPRGRFEIQRFRPNLVIETASAGPGFVENSWAGHTLALGAEVLLRVSMPCPRCVMTTLPQADLPHDPAILRTAAQHNRLDLGQFGELPCVGVYADIVRPGLIRRGDAVRVVE